MDYDRPCAQTGEENGQKINHSPKDSQTENSRQAIQLQSQHASKSLSFSPVNPAVWVRASLRSLPGFKFNGFAFLMVKVSSLA